jgi:hypothetical protein
MRRVEKRRRAVPSPVPTASGSLPASDGTARRITRFRDGMQKTEVLVKDGQQEKRNGNAGEGWTAGEKEW